MAYVPIHGANSTAKIRNVVYVAIMVVITLGIYVIFWWYYINREMADYGRALGTDELGDNPAKSTLALFPGVLIIVPAIWTVVTTFKRARSGRATPVGADATQRLARPGDLRRLLARPVGL